MKGFTLLILSLIVTYSLCSFSCTACESVIKTFASTLSFITPDYLAVEGLYIICLRKYDSQKLCKKVGKQLAPLAIQNFIKDRINPDKKCSILCHNQFVYYYPDLQSQRILTGNPLPLINLSYYLQKEEFQLPSNQIIKILHLSDIHQDSNYVEKASINCEYPICCHQQNGFPQNIDAQAPPYGSKNCDSPPKLLDSFLDYIDKQQKTIDIILGTGDFSAHNEWQKTDQSINKLQKKIAQKLYNKFPNSLFLKIDGNNDYIPDHQYNPQIKPKLIKQSTINIGNITLTFVGLNTIVFDDYNLYLLGDQSYAIFQLMMLEQILKEKDNVYIYGHISPTTNGAAVQYLTVFRALVAKYSSKIKGQFYGHTHADELVVNTYPNTQNVTGYGFICPSMSSLYIGYSRSRVYKVIVGQLNGVNDYTQYILKNLSQQNPQWSNQYKFRERYNLSKEEQPITLQQIARIKNKIMSSQQQQNRYLRTTGLNQQYNNKSYCLIIDDLQLRKKCYHQKQQLMDKLHHILDVIRGKWGYHVNLVK